MLSTLSFNEKIFQEVVLPYQKTLQNPGYRIYTNSPKNVDKNIKTAPTYIKLNEIANDK